MKRPVCYSAATVLLQYYHSWEPTLFNPSDYPLASGQWPWLECSLGLAAKAMYAPERSTPTLRALRSTDVRISVVNSH